MNILVTGGAGFIGSHLSKQLVSQGHTVVSVDNHSTTTAWLHRARESWAGNAVRQIRIDITNRAALEKVFSEHKFDLVYHLAAKAGVRASTENPVLHAETNYIGTLHVFECARKFGVTEVVFASTSSVYGRNQKFPFAESDRVDAPVSVYASTKRSGELLAATYCDLFNLNITCLRFFTVYGPFGRPDMAPWIFTEKICSDEVIQVFDHGNHRRDFTYIDDIVAGCVGAMQALSGFTIINLGRGETVELLQFIKTIENISGKQARIEFVAAQLGDVNVTSADLTKANQLLNYNPNVSIEEGLRSFIDWYQTTVG